MRWIDELRTRPRLDTPMEVPEKSWLAYEKEVRDILDSDLPVFVVDNVYQFADAKWGRPGHGTVNLGTDFVNAVPPFERFWMEWKTSGGAFPRQLDHWGVLCFSYPDKEQPGGWILALTGIARGGRGRAVLTPKYVYVRINPDGSCKSFGMGPLPIEGARLQDPDVKWMDLVASYLLTNVLLSLCFMNCRNVSVKWIPTPPALMKSFRKKHGTPPVARTGTIEIFPMTKLIAEGARGAKGGITREMAAHICRQHFKTYTPENPLFGKVTGTYLWHPYVRSKKPGEAAPDSKEYEINLRGKTPKPPHWPPKE